MMEIAVRLISGEELTVECEDHSLKQFRKLLAQQRPSLETCKLFYQGAPLQSKQTLSSLNIAPGTFLVALEGRHRGVLPQEEAAGTASPVPYPKASHRTLDSLLPGYSSRPHASPVKSSRRTAVGQQLPMADPAEDALGRDGRNGGGSGVPTLADLAASRQQPRMPFPVAAAAALPQPQLFEELQREMQQAAEEDGGHAAPAEPHLPEISCEAMATLALPACLRPLEAKFRQLIAFHDFLLRAHVPPTWKALHDTMHSAPSTLAVSLEDVKLMERLCPHVVSVTAAAAADPELAMVSMVDAWQGRAHALPGWFLEETAEMQAPAAASRKPAVNFAVKAADDEGEEVDEEQQEQQRSVRKRRRPRANVQRRMAWAFRTAAIAALAVLQGRYFGGQVPPLAISKPKKADPLRSRRSKAGRQALAAAAEVVPLVDDAAEDAPPAELKALLHEGTWHPSFPLDSCRLADVLSAAASLQKLKPSGGTESAASPMLPPPQKRARSSHPAPPQALKKHSPCTDKTPLSAPAFLEHLQSRPSYNSQVSHVQRLPARAAAYAELDPPPLPQVAQALQRRGVTRLYSHQGEAIAALRSGRHTCVCTSTASGKSLCYVVPILEALAANPAACAILIFPTKALAQDQLRALREMCAAAFGDAAPAVDIYDGDTAMGDRGDIRARAQLLLTNPDMIHVSMLPVHHQFERMLSSLAYCVVDEGHSYKGAFGCHVALVIRRLRRVCRLAYGANPTFAVTTATVANPAQHTAALLGVEEREVVVVARDGSPHAAKDFVLWNPPMGAADSAAEAAREAARASARSVRQERSCGAILGQGWSEEEWRAAVEKGHALGGPAASTSPRKGSTARGANPESHPQPSAADEKIQQQLQQPTAPAPPKMTAKQRKLAAQAAAALSAAAGSSARRAPLPPLADVDAAGSVLPKRRLIRIGPAASSVASEREGAQAKLPTGQEWKESRESLSAASPATKRASSIFEIAALLAEAVQHGLRTIAFCGTRKLSELVTAYCAEILGATAPELRAKVATYRSGYSPAERRQTEAALFSGALLGVAATNALELGVDIGGLDCTLHLGFPGSIASLWQQAGRAGRRDDPSISIYIGWNSPLDQYFMANPEQLFAKPIEAALVDPGNPVALQEHAACAAFELPLDAERDAQFFGHGLRRVVEALMSGGALGRHPQLPGLLRYTGPKTSPASATTLRAIDPGRYAIVDESAGGAVIEEIEESKAFFQVYDGAVCMHCGRSFLCSKLDLDARVAIVKPVDVKYYTQTVDFTAVQTLGSGESAFGYHHQPSRNAASAPLPPDTRAACSRALVTTRWLGYVRVWRGTGKVFDSVDLFLPDVQFETDSVYLRLPPTARRSVEAAGLPFRDGVHAAAHAVLNVLPLFLMANPQDVGTECDSPWDTRFKPERILIYDQHPGGMGLSTAARPNFTEILQRALALVSCCPCSAEKGCPGCVQHTHCGEYNVVLNKEAAKLVLEAALEAETAGSRDAAETVAT